MSTQNTTTDVHTKNSKIKEFFRKQCANILSAARIIGAIVLFFFTKVSYPFVIIYVFCGITDLLDGRIARKLNITSSIGAFLDTVGDVLTYLAFAKILIMQNLIPWWIIAWYLVAMVFNLIGGIIAKKRFDEFYFIHSFFGRALGVVLFVLPLLLRMTQAIENNNYYCLSLICIVATISGLESIYIQARSKEKHMEITSLKQFKNL